MIVPTATRFAPRFAPFYRLATDVGHPFKYGTSSGVVTSSLAAERAGHPSKSAV